MRCRNSDTVLTMRGWLIYDVKFNGTRVMLAHEDDPGTSAILRDYLDNTEAIAMPRLPMPKRNFPQLGFWCTIAMRRPQMRRSSTGRHSGRDTPSNATLPVTSETPGKR